jgi:hypothetical protein
LVLDAALPALPVVNDVRTEVASNITITTVVPGTLPVQQSNYLFKTIRSIAVTNTSTARLPASTVTIGVTWTPPVIPALQSQSFILYNKSVVPPSTGWVAIGSVYSYNSPTPTEYTETVDATFDATAYNWVVNETHTDQRPVSYLLEGADAKGFLLQGTTTITFDNN